MLLPSIIKQIYAAKPNTLADILSPMVQGLKGDDSETDKAVEGVRNWLHSVGLAPIDGTKEVVRQIYQDSF